MKCCICDIEMTHEIIPDGEYFGNSAQPVADGRCCDWCDRLKVTPARMGKTGEEAELMGRALIHTVILSEVMFKEMMKKKANDILTDELLGED